MEVLQRHGVAANFLLRHSPLSPSQIKKKKKEERISIPKPKIQGRGCCGSDGREKKSKESNSTSGNGETERKGNRNGMKIDVGFEVRNRKGEKKVKKMDE